MRNATTGWGYFQEGQQQLLSIMELGKKLNLAIGCPVVYPAFGKRMFECECHKVFPAYLVEGNSPEDLAKIHRERH